MLNFEITMVVGILPATACVIIIVLAFILIPILLYQCHVKRRERFSHARATKELFKWLLEDVYDPEKMGQVSECSICLDTYIIGVTKVTLLPCQGQHSFHTECIKQWFKDKHICPLDK
jgi:hypothetical protein